MKWHFVGVESTQEIALDSCKDVDGHYWGHGRYYGRNDGRGTGTGYGYGWGDWDGGGNGDGYDYGYADDAGGGCGYADGDGGSPPK